MSSKNRTTFSFTSLNPSFLIENVEVQIHRNLGQARNQHQRAIRGAAQDGDEEASVPAAHRGHRHEEEEMLPHVDFCLRQILQGLFL